MQGSGKEKVLAKFRGKRSLTASGIGTGKAVLAVVKELMAEGGVVKIGAYYFLAESAPTIERERERLGALLKKTRKLLKESAFRWTPRSMLHTTKAALDRLVDDRVVLRLEVEKDKKLGFLYLHASHAGGEMPREVGGLKDGTDAYESRVRSAYAALVGRSGMKSVFIADLARESGLGVEELKKWIEKEVVGRGIGTLDEGDWSYATEEQRSAAVWYRDRRRLYLSLQDN